MEAYILKYKMRRLVSRLWYWTRQLLMIGLLIGLAMLAWTWQDRTAERITAKSGDAVHVVDGDTLTIGSGASVRPIRIQGIDAPEYHQTCRDERGHEWSCGKEARDTLQLIVKAGGLECTIAANDNYHRTIGICKTVGTADIGREMVRRGMAVSGAEKTDSRWNNGGPYLFDEVAAQKSKRGIWRGSFQRPADWRETVKSSATAAANAANDP